MIVAVSTIFYLFLRRFFAEGFHAKPASRIGKQLQKTRPYLQEENCWLGNFSRPSLRENDDFLVDIQLTSLEDFDFHFEECKVLKLNKVLLISL